MTRVSNAATAAVAAGFALDEVVAVSHAAPASIHRFTASISSAVSGSPCAGIGGRSRPAIRRYNRLAPASPGTRSDPRAPPRSALSRVLRSSLPNWTASPWHERQLRSRIGSTSLAKETGCGGATTAA
jgi:hypothetical protein